MFGAFGGWKSGQLNWKGKMGLFLVPIEGSLLSLPEENVQEEALLSTDHTDFCSGSRFW